MTATTLFFVNQKCGFRSAAGNYIPCTVTSIGSRTMRAGERTWLLDGRSYGNKLNATLMPWQDEWDTENEQARKREEYSQGIVNNANAILRMLEAPHRLLPNKSIGELELLFDQILTAREALEEAPELKGRRG